MFFFSLTASCYQLRKLQLAGGPAAPNRRKAKILLIVSVADKRDQIMISHARTSNSNDHCLSYLVGSGQLRIDFMNNKIESID